MFFDRINKTVEESDDHQIQRDIDYLVELYTIDDGIENIKGLEVMKSRLVKELEESSSIKIQISNGEFNTLSDKVSVRDKAAMTLKGLIDSFEEKVKAIADDSGWVKSDISILDIERMSRELLDDRYDYSELSYAEYYDLIRHVRAIQKLSHLVNHLSSEIKFIINQLTTKLRDLRLVFKKLHSFHFKNLDDYHKISFNLGYIG